MPEKDILDKEYSIWKAQNSMFQKSEVVAKLEHRLNTRAQWEKEQSCIQQPDPNSTFRCYPVGWDYYIHWTRHQFRNTETEKHSWETV